MKNTLREIIGRNIRNFCKKAGFTQEGLSEYADVDYKYIQRIEGKNPPALKADTIEKLARALKIDPCQLLKH